MSKKRILVSLLCLGAVLGVAACEKTPPVVTPTPPVTETPVTPTPTPEVVKYTVTFNSNGGSAVASAEVEQNKKVSAPTAPTKEGYTFVGWFSDEALTKEWKFDSDVVTANTTLYAKWEEVVAPVEKFNVTYNANGHGEQPAEVTDVLALPAELPVLTAEGYNFFGWYTDEALTQKAIPGVEITANTTLYAKWEVVKYSVTYDINEHGEQPAVVNDVLALPAELPVLTALGYTFLGWYTDEACTTAAVAGAEITANTVLYAKWELTTYTVSYNINGHGEKPANAEKVVALPAELPVLTAEGYTFLGWYTDEALQTKAEVETPITADTTLYAKWAKNYNVSFVMNGYGADAAAMSVAILKGLPKPIDETGAKVFTGWYTDAELKNKVVEGTLITADVTLYAEWKDSEQVVYTLKDTDFVPGKNEADMVINNYTILAGSEMRTRGKTWSGKEMHIEDGKWVSSTLEETASFAQSLKLGSKGNLVINAQGHGVLSIWIQNGSSGAASQFITFGKVGEEVETIEFPGTNEGSPIVKVSFEVEAGCQYILGRPSGTVDLYWAELDVLVEKSDVVGFDIVNEGTVDYLVGDTYDSSRLAVSAVYGSGRLETIALDDAELVIDSSKVDFSKAGVYQVSVKYRDYDVQIIDVAVYAVSDLELGFNAVAQTGSSSAGNGVYFNHTVQQVYLKDAESLDPSHLTVTAIAIHPTDSTKTMEFVLSASEFTLSTLDASTAGKKEISVSYNLNSEVVAKFNVWVVDTAPSIVDGVVQVKVDPSYEGVVGTVVEGYNVFTTIQQALDYLEASEIKATVKKLLYISEGTYNEKLEITIPYLTIKGAGADKTLVEWDSLYGLKDEGGFTHNTDSTTSVAIRDTAYNCVVEDITFSNYWNSLERFDKDLGENYQEHRALALLVQADKFIMRNSKLLGYQDTVEFFYGRQLLENVYIAGTTDFIFGTNNTTYFKNCTIHSIDSHANKGDKSDGGYITAFKGCNTGAGDAVKYGAIFDGCKFTATDDVLADGNTAVGRTWGPYAAVMIMNSELGSHITKTENKEGTAGKNVRVVSMNSINVATSETIQFFEYNNTGAGAITESQKGVTVLTDAAEAAKYADYSIIFGKTNGKVSYMEAWDPNNTEIVEDSRTYYYFDQKSSDTGTSYTYDIETPSFKGSTLALGDITISAENGNVAWNQNANALNMKANSFIKFNVKAGTEVTVNTYPKYNFFTLNGVGTSNSSTLSQYYEEDTEVVLMSTGDLYLYSIIINPEAEAPEAPVLEEVKVEGLNVNYIVGEELSYEGLVVKACYSDSSIIVLSAEDYVVNAEAVKKDEAGSYDITFTYGGKTVAVAVTYEDPNADPAITINTVLSFATVSGYEAVQNNKRVTMEGSFRFNGAEYEITGTISFPVKAGTVVTVNPYANSQYAAYTIGAEGQADLETLNAKSTFTAVKDCTVVYTGLSNNYLVSIEILCPVSNQTYVFGTGNTEKGDYTKVVESVGNIVVSGSVRDNSDSLQINEGASITFAVPAFSTVVLTGHSEGYGKLAATLNGVPAELVSNGSGVYTFSTKVATLVVINPVNVGTEDAPAYNKSYIKAISVSTPNEVAENVTVTFGSKGNYKDSGFDFSGIQIGDNGDDNSQVKNGSFSFIVNKGAIVTINGFSGYTSYKLSDGTTTTDEITSIAYTYEADGTVLLTITPVDGNNYFYSFSVEYPVELETYASDAEIDLSACDVAFEKSKGVWNNIAIDATNGKWANNNGGWIQVNANTTFSFNVANGAIVDFITYNGTSDKANYAVEIVDGVCTVTVTNQVYFGKLFISYGVDYTDDATVDLTALVSKVEKNNIQWKGLTIDATSGKFANNGNGWIQVNAGTVVSFTVAEGASVSLVTYNGDSDKTKYTVVVEGTTCTITASAQVYFKTLKVEYLYDFTKEIELDLSQSTEKIEGKASSWKGIAIDATNGKWANNNGGWIQVNANTTFSFNVANGAIVDFITYNGASDKANYAVEIVDGVCTVTATNQVYFGKLIVSYPVDLTKDIELDLTQLVTKVEKNNIQWKGLTIDATSGKFANNGNGWIQVNAGTVVSFTVAEGANVSLVTYNGDSDKAKYTVVVEGTTCTITASAQVYFKTLTIAYPAAPEASDAQPIKIDAAQTKVDGAGIMIYLADKPAITVDDITITIKSFESTQHAIHTDKILEGATKVHYLPETGYFYSTVGVGLPNGGDQVMVVVISYELEGVTYSQELTFNGNKYDDGIEDEEVPAITSGEAIAIDATQTKVDGAGIMIYLADKPALNVSDIQLTVKSFVSTDHAVHTDAILAGANIQHYITDTGYLYATVAVGLPNGGDQVMVVSVAYTLNGVNYYQELTFTGNAYTAE